MLGKLKAHPSQRADLRMWTCLPTCRFEDLASVCLAPDALVQP